MTEDRIVLREMLEEGSDAALLREMIGFAAQRLMELGTEAPCGAGMARRATVPRIAIANEVLFNRSRLTCGDCFGNVRVCARYQGSSTSTPSSNARIIARRSSKGALATRHPRIVASDSCSLMASNGGM